MAKQRNIALGTPDEIRSIFNRLNESLNKNRVPANFESQLDRLRAMGATDAAENLSIRRGTIVSALTDKELFRVSRAAGIDTPFIPDPVKETVGRAVQQRATSGGQQLLKPVEVKQLGDVARLGRAGDLRLSRIESRLGGAIPGGGAGLRKVLTSILEEESGRVLASRRRPAVGRIRSLVREASRIAPVAEQALRTTQGLQGRLGGFLTGGGAGTLSRVQQVVGEQFARAGQGASAAPILQAAQRAARTLTPRAGLGLGAVGTLLLLLMSGGGDDAPNPVVQAQLANLLQQQTAEQALQSSLLRSREASIENKELDKLLKIVRLQSLLPGTGSGVI